MRYWLRNLPHRARGLKQELMALAKIGVTSELRATVTRADGTVEDLGVLGRRVVTDIGAAYVVDAFQNLVELEAVNYHQSGTNTTAENASDTDLGTATGSRGTGTQSEPSSTTYRSTATIAYTSTLAITEHGIFWASSGASTLFDRTVFSAINVINGDSITFQYTLTVNSGG